MTAEPWYINLYAIRKHLERLPCNREWVRIGNDKGYIILQQEYSKEENDELEDIELLLDISDADEMQWYSSMTWHRKQLLHDNDAWKNCRLKVLFESNATAQEYFLYKAGDIHRHYPKEKLPWKCSCQEQNIKLCNCVTMKKLYNDSRKKAIIDRAALLHHTELAALLQGDVKKFMEVGMSDLVHASASIAKMNTTKLLILLGFTGYDDRTTAVPASVFNQSQQIAELCSIILNAMKVNIPRIRTTNEWKKNKNWVACALKTQQLKLVICKDNNHGPSKYKISVMDEDYINACNPNHDCIDNCMDI